MNSQPPSKELLSDRLAEFSHELHESQLLDLCELVDDAKDMEAEIERLKRERDESRAAEARWKQTCQRMSAGAAHEPPAGRYFNSGYCDTACGWIVREEGKESWPATFATERLANRFVAMMNGAAEPPCDDWIAVTERLPAWTDDYTEHILVYSSTHDWGGTQFAVMRQADFYHQDDTDDIGTADTKVVTHWKPLAGPTPTKEVTP